MSLRLQRRCIAFAVALAGMAPSVVAAADERHRSTQGLEVRPGDVQAAADAPLERMDLRASRLIGKQVRNVWGDHLGEVRDLVLDVNNQRLHYAVLALGRAQGSGHLLFAYPVALLRPTGEAGELLLQAAPESLERAPGFSRDRWPDWTDKRYRDALERYFGPTVSPLYLPNQQLVRVTELLRREVRDHAGRATGVVADIVVNLAAARVRYVVLELDRASASQERLLPLGLPSFSIPARRDAEVVLTTPRDQLDLSAAFEPDHWPLLDEVSPLSEDAGHGGRTAPQPRVPPGEDLRPSRP